MIRMVNQTGDGYADAYSESEAQTYISKGWRKFVTPEAVAEQPAEEDAQSEQAAPRKRGRPAKVE